MAKYIATARGYDNVKIREKGEVFEYKGKPGSWMKPYEGKALPEVEEQEAEETAAKPAAKTTKKVKAEKKAGGKKAKAEAKTEEKQDEASDSVI
jgi:hypothetical protein